MTVTVVKAGMLSTLQAGPRSGRRHLGIPGGGAADPLSLALANRLLGNAWDTPAIEATLTGPVLRFDADASVAVAGAAVSVTLNGREEGCHRSFVAKAGDELAIGAAETGARAYVAVGGGFSADDALGSKSTDLQAGFGGYRGRALKTGDELAVGGVTGSDITTPADFQPNFSNAWAVRVCEAAETGWLDQASREALFATNWVVDRRADRMGLRLDGPVSCPARSSARRTGRRTCSRSMPEPSAVIRVLRRWRASTGMCSGSYAPGTMCACSRERRTRPLRNCVRRSPAGSRGCRTSRRFSREIGGPARTRTWDQGIHCTRSFPNGADYLITLDRVVRGGTL
ncbi:MAG: hypothetical protein P8X94_11945 [Woeseiaceae bacterium]